MKKRAYEVIFESMKIYTRIDVEILDVSCYYFDTTILTSRSGEIQVGKTLGLLY